MERMGDILAKVANRRTALQRQAGNATQPTAATPAQSSAPKKLTSTTGPEPLAPREQATTRTGVAAITGRASATVQADATRPAPRPRPTPGRATLPAPVGPRASQATRATRGLRATPTPAANDTTPTEKAPQPLPASAVSDGSLPTLPAPIASKATATNGGARPATPTPQTASAASAASVVMATHSAPATRREPPVARHADTRIPTPARPVAPDAQPTESAEPILELPRRRTPAHAASAASAMPAPAMASMPLPAGSASSAPRADFYAPLMSGVTRASAGATTTRRTGANHDDAHRGLGDRNSASGADHGPVASQHEPAESTGARRTPPRRSAESDAVSRGAERPQQSRQPFHAPAGMLPLGDAARSYLDAIAPRRRRAQPDDVAGDATNDRSAGRASRGAQARTAQPSPPLAPDVCPICLGVGYVRADAPVGDPAFGQALPCVCKERQLEERRRSDLWRISSLAPFEKKTFETFEGAVTPGVREAYEAARHYADDPQGWLILSGGYGVGKTHLAAAIANYQLSRGAHVFFSIVPDLLDHLRAAFAPSSEAPFDEMFDRVREAGLLVLDDLGAENGTAWATEKLFQLINYRYNFRMPTVITTNHRLLSHMDERIRSRLADLSLVRRIAIEAPDYRERHSGRPSRPAPRASSAGRGRQ